MPKKLDVNVYLDAAALVEAGAGNGTHYSCYAVDAAAGRDFNYMATSPEAQKYYNTFCPCYSSVPAELAGGYWNGRNTKRNQLQRSIALLFMAEMVNDGAV